METTVKQNGDNCKTNWRQLYNKMETTVQQNGDNCITKWRKL
jgi:hypothetical protein